MARDFEDRKTHVNFQAFDKIMRRRSGKPRREGNEMPRQKLGPLGTSEPGKRGTGKGVRSLFGAFGQE